MGIYVPFLKKMPSRCEFCPLIGGTGCRARNPYYMDETGITRPKNCPLVELPPHGRLIDADALAKSIKDQIELIKQFRNEELDRVAQIIEAGYLQEIANAPTILEAEVKP